MLRKLFAALVGLLLSLNIAFAATDANTASKEDLDKVKGIGPAIAQKIVDERQKNGPFKSLDDLAQRVKGVGDTSVKKMAAEGLTVGGSSATGTTAAAPAKAAEAKADTKAEKKSKKAEAAKADTAAATPAADKASDAKPAKKTKAELKAEKAAAKADAAASAASAPEKKSRKSKKDAASAPKA